MKFMEEDGPSPKHRGVTQPIVPRRQAPALPRHRPSPKPSGVKQQVVLRRRAPPPARLRGHVCRGPSVDRMPAQPAGLWARPRASRETQAGERRSAPGLHRTSCPKHALQQPLVQLRREHGTCASRHHKEAVNCTACSNALRLASRPRSGPAEDLAVGWGEGLP